MTINILERSTRVQQEGEVRSVDAGILFRTGWPQLKVPAHRNGTQQVVTEYFEHNEALRAPEDMAAWAVPIESTVGESIGKEPPLQL